jgi:hypothetical protein
MICVTVECKPDTRCSEGTRNNWSKANKEAIARDLESTDWRLELDWRTTEDGWRFMKSILGETIDKNVPTLKGNIKFKHPWMTRDILKLIRKKRRKWRKAKNSASEWEKEEYKKIEKEVANKIRNAKRKLEKNLVAGEDKNKRKFTQYVKSKTKSRTSVGPLVTKDKKILSEPKDMARELNNFFGSVFTQEDLTVIPEAEEEEVQQNMPPITVSQQDVLKKIRALRKDAAAGPDGLTPRVLKEFEAQLAKPLEILFNKSILTGEIPEDWRKANVTPIFKKGTKGDPGNYRPVSITSVPCKLLESIIKDRLLHHLMANKLIKDTQHGFMPGRSCATNLTEFMDKVTRSVDEGSSVDIIYLDFAKAFD